MAPCARRRRIQRGSVTKSGDSWRGWWKENGQRHSLILGKRAKITKSGAREMLDRIVSRGPGPAASMTLGEFLWRSFFPLYERKWKASTCCTAKQRIQQHILGAYKDFPLDSIRREELQAFLDRKAGLGLSASVVAHLRWDLRSIFRLALADRLIGSSPAEVLVIPAAQEGERRIMTAADVRVMLSALDERDSLICRLATIGGMRPGEIFGLQWRHLRGTHFEIEQRIYRRKLDSPKSRRGHRQVAISRATALAFEAWRSRPEAEASEWIFPSEARTTPEDRANVLTRRIVPALERVGLGWVNFQVMRRTHSSLRRSLGDHPKAVADQLGHTVDVDLNVYAQTPLEDQARMIEALESSLSARKLLT